MLEMERTLIILLVMGRMSHPTEGANVLHMPQNINSHIINQGRLACALAKEGHHIGFLLPSNSKIPSFLKKCNVDVVQYKVMDDIPYINTEEASNMFISISLAKSFIGRAAAMSNLGPKLSAHWDEECIAMLESSEVRDHLSKTRYDVAILDSTGLRCHPVLPYSLDIPIIIYGAHIADWLFRVPSLPTFVPSAMSRFSDRMTFWERLQNIFETLLPMAVFSMMNVKQKECYEKFAPTKPPVTSCKDILKYASLFLRLDDPAISYPRPSMPNVVVIGDIMFIEAEPLPDDIKTFVEGAKQGVVMVSFGSYFDYMPRDIAAKFCSVFKKLPQKVIWKLTNPLLCEADPDQVKLLSWLPQNDLLGHTNVKLFISHCGLNSVLESVYQATPVLGVPIAIDQSYHATMIQSKGYGLQMKLNDFTEEELRNKVLNILENSTFQNNVQKASALMKHKADDPGKRASFWIDHVLTHGDSHLRTAAFELNIFQFLMIDVLLTLLFGLLLFVLIIVYTVKYCFKGCKRCHEALSKKIKTD